MLKFTLLAAVITLFSCKSTSYFIVRHAEKETATMSSDVPLSAAGRQRADALRELLATHPIKHIYATNYIRTKSTAAPLASALGLAVQPYEPADSGFVERVKKLGKGDVVIVGHSNTVDDLVNTMMGERIIESDLPDSQYGDLFVIIRRGSKYKLEKRHFGK